MKTVEIIFVVFINVLQFTIEQTDQLVDIPIRESSVLDQAILTRLQPLDDGSFLHVFLHSISTCGMPIRSTSEATVFISAVLHCWLGFHQVSTGVASDS